MVNKRYWVAVTKGLPDRGVKTTTPPRLDNKIDYSIIFKKVNIGQPTQQSLFEIIVYWWLDAKNRFAF